MLNFTELLQQGPAHAWLFVPTAIALGALHGMEPGHSKTMMAAFIIAVRGTVVQAVLLGLAATVSHTIVVWLIALAGLHFGSAFNTDASEPWLQVVSAVLILGIAVWMVWRTWRERRPHRRGHHQKHGHKHGHDHHHGHGHDTEVAAELAALAGDKFSDAHERAHAEDIQRRFANRTVTTGQIVLFGLTGGLIPCPASITVLLICLQLKQVALGAALVFCFSIGLAITMVVVGAAAALSVNHVAKRWTGFGTIARRAPYLSGTVMAAIALYTGFIGVAALT
jgi:ABC-type nickel/cobalt efflux system permease component RcnA